MSLIEQIGLRAMRSFDPEQAHGLAIKALKLGLAPSSKPVTSERLKTSIAGIDLANPIGLAAGFDKNAEVLGPLSKSGFGFIEVGAVTPRAQPGNPKPRLFRLTEDQAAINRFGFNNEGTEAVLPRLAKRPKNAVIGLNLGANKDSTDRAKDFQTVLAECGAHLDFATVNVSSPNTEKLRDLQGKDALLALLNGVMDTRASLETPIPVFLKIAPDLSDAEIQDVAEVALETGIDAVITTNTTLSRDGLKSPHKDQLGGLSGAPLFEASTRGLAKLSILTDAMLPLIGVGGVSNAEQSYATILAGASAVQLYTALVYHGISLGAKIARDLDRLLERDGYSSVQDAVAQGREEWL